MRAQRFEDIRAWQSARELAGAVYDIARTRQLAGDYALARQMQRAEASVMANIAEGFGRSGAVEFHRFVTIARGSCFELLSHLYLATDVGYIQPHELEPLRKKVEEVSRLLRALRESLDQAKNHPRASRA